jgi:hypothetical protein
MTSALCWSELREIWRCRSRVHVYEILSSGNEILTRLLETYLARISFAGKVSGTVPLGEPGSRSLTFLRSCCPRAGVVAATWSCSSRSR